MTTFRQKIPAPIKVILRPIYHGSIRFLNGAVAAILEVVRWILGPYAYITLCNFVSRHANMSIEIAGIRFVASGNIPLRRAVTALTKEPRTIAWIDDFVRPGDVFYDVGANVGVFSLYAAVKKHAIVIAFEPLADNYAILNRNIYLNRLSDCITAYNLALHDENMVSWLFVSEMSPGKAGNTFGRAVGSTNGSYEAAFIQGTVGFRMDSFIETYDVPFPNHVKIDVDGNDARVVAGMERLLQDSRMRTLAVELAPDARPGDAIVFERLKAFDFRLLEDSAYLNVNDPCQEHIHNYFFVRR